MRRHLQVSCLAGTLTLKWTSTRLYDVTFQKIVVVKDLLVYLKYNVERAREYSRYNMSLLLGIILIQLNPVLKFIPHFTKIHFNNIILQNVLLPSGFRAKMLYTYLHSKLKLCTYLDISSFYADMILVGES
jgi:hypothetical protein